METIENEYLKVTINNKGALLTSILYKAINEEMLYQIEKDSWPFQDVVIFPLIGKGEYVYNNQKYEIETRHGFLRNSLLNVEAKEKDKITFSFTSNKETLSVYPFSFKFLITYSLDKSSIKVNTTIVNLDSKTIYFSYGSHTGIRASSEIGSITFDKDYQLLPLICGLINQNSEENLLFNCANLKKDSFKKLDTLVFKGNSETLSLFTGIKECLITYSFDAPYFAIWSNANKGEFVCVEPWWGISNYVDEPVDLESRIAINKLKENEKISFSYSLTFSIDKSID